MPPQRNFSGKKDYKDRNARDHLLEFLPPSTNETPKGESLILTMPHFKVDEGFYDGGNLLRDAKVSVSGLEFFKRWFSQQNHGTPFSNVWDFEVEKIILPGVFMDEDLFVTLAKGYDLVLRVVKNVSSTVLFEVNVATIREVFKLTTSSSLLEEIDLGRLQASYDAQRIYLMSSPLQENFAKVGGLYLVTSATPKPLMRKRFNLRAQALHSSLCQVLDVDEMEKIPGYMILMMAQILQYGLTSIFDFATYLSKEIQKAFICIAQGEFDKPFGWYSFFMHICLFK